MSDDDKKETALQTTDDQRTMLRMVATPDEVLQRQTEVRDLIQRCLRKGRDYGTIPGCGPKPSLFKPGAERINAAFGVQVEMRVEMAETDHDRENHYLDKRGKQCTSWGLYRYRVACVLRDGDRIIGKGEGLASTMESKYIGRPADSENTVLKMAQKRALVGVTLVTYGLSEQFTQDLEDGDRGQQLPPDLQRHQPKKPARDTTMSKTDEADLATMLHAVPLTHEQETLKELAAKAADLCSPVQLAVYRAWLGARANISRGFEMDQGLPARAVSEAVRIMADYPGDIIDADFDEGVEAEVAQAIDDAFGPSHGEPDTQGLHDDADLPF